MGKLETRDKNEENKWEKRRKKRTQENKWKRHEKKGEKRGGHEKNKKENMIKIEKKEKGEKYKKR